MRKQFFQILEELAKKDKDIILIVDDLGFGYYENFKKKFPKQFINAGIIEQSIIGIACGLAIAGKKPYCYGALPFMLFRPYEFIRNDVAYNNLPVKIIAYGSTGFLGFTHNLEGKENEEDLLKNLPNIERHYPKNEKELKKALLRNKPQFIKI